MRRAALAICILAALAAAADDVPVVKVKVILDSGAARKKGVVLADAEKEAAKVLVKSIVNTGKLSFVRWEPDHPGIRGAAAELTVKLWDVKPYADLPSVHHVAYGAEIMAENAKKKYFPLGYADGEKFFTTREQRDQLDASGTLASALSKIVLSHLIPKDPNQHLLDTFLYLIPLSNTTPELKGDGSIVVHLPWDDLKAKDDSVLRIHIGAKPPNERNPEEGRIMLSGLFSCGNCDRPSTRGAFRGFRCNGFTTVEADEQQKWIELCPPFATR